MTDKRQIVVQHFNGSFAYYPVSIECGGWKIDATTRCILIGKGVPRTWIPLDNVVNFSIEEY